MPSESAPLSVTRIRPLGRCATDEVQHLDSHLEGAGLICSFERVGDGGAVRSHERLARPVVHLGYRPKRYEASVAGEVPNQQQLVRPGRVQRAAVWAERRVADRPRVAGEDGLLLAAAKVPDHHALVDRRRCEPRPVPTERQIEDVDRRGPRAGCVPSRSRIRTTRRR